MSDVKEPEEFLPDEYLHDHEDTLKGLSLSSCQPHRTIEDKLVDKIMEIRFEISTKRKERS